MLLRLFQLLSTVLGLALATSADAELIRTAVPRASLNYLSIYAAEAKGFFKDEGLENETIAIGGPAAIAALLSGNVDFSGAGAADCAPPRKERS
jgi:ABC-type nitrate/sulfonate/bicarbonate transport system substrate-binding protein